MISYALQKMNQINAFTQNTFDKTEQQICNAFTNILQNKMQNTHSQNQQYQIQETLVNSQQSKQVQQSLEEVDFDLLSKNSSSKQQSDDQVNAATSMKDINYENSYSEQTPVEKKMAKKAGKRDNVSINSYKNRNNQSENAKETLKQIKKQQNISQTVRQNGSQSNKQDEQESQVNKVVQYNVKRSKVKSQLDVSELLQIKPEIKIYQDQKLKQSILKSMTEENNQVRNQIREVDFIIEIPLSQENQTFIKENPFNKLCKQPSKFSNIQDIKKDNQSSIQQAGQVKTAQRQEKTDKIRYKTKSHLQKNNNDVQEIQPVQMKQSKIKNNFNRQTILKASMTSESLNDSKINEDLYTNNNRKIVNLAQVSLRDLVKQLYIKKIISQALYKQFIQNHEIYDIKDYIVKFQAGKLRQFDFKNIKFTILDHRKIAELLVNLYPDKYVIGDCYNSDDEIYNFMIKLYELDGQQYFNLYTKIDNISGLKWWGKILITQEERLMELNKERRITRRKAEKASLAVQELIQNARKKATENNLTQSQAKVDNKITNSSVYKNHNTFFGQSEEQKELSKKRRQQIRQIAKIRQMVSNNFSSKTNQNQQSENNKPTMRKKIRFY